MLWVVFALLTGAAIFAVLWPLSRAPAVTDARELDVSFYKAQAAEIDRDVARGVIGDGEAEIARNEAARRLMAASRHAPRDVRRASPFATKAVALGALLFVPIAALGLYMQIGAPNMPDEPLEARLAADPSKMDMATIMARIERNVAKDPNDGRGWALLARLYTRLGRPDNAAAAFRNEIRVLGPNEERLSGLGEVETVAAGGRVTPDARKHFDQASGLDPKAPRPRYYLALAAEQGGDKTQAVKIWKAIVADGPPDAPWLPTIKSRIAAAAGEPLPPPPMASADPSGAGGADGGAAGMGSVAGEEGRGVAPPPKMAAAVAAMPKDQQQAMIHGMVDRLAERLKANGTDIDGWLRLVRAYRVLDEQDKAKVALSDARRNFAADTGAKKRLDELAHELGLES